MHAWHAFNDTIIMDKLQKEKMIARVEKTSIVQYLSQCNRDRNEEENSE